MPLRVNAKRPDEYSSGRFSFHFTLSVALVLVLFLHVSESKSPRSQVGADRAAYLLETGVLDIEPEALDGFFAQFFSELAVACVREVDWPFGVDIGLGELFPDDLLRSGGSLGLRGADQLLRFRLRWSA